MKKNRHMISFFALVLLCLCSQPAQALLAPGSMADGFLVPLATFGNSPAADTVVGITCLAETGTIYWTFFSANGIPLVNGTIDTAGKRFHQLSLAAVAPLWSDMSGYLIFVYDDDGILQSTEARSVLAGNAILLKTGSEDACFIPCIPLVRSDFASVDLDPDNMNAADLQRLTYGAGVQATSYARYWVDPIFAAKTEIVVWTASSSVGSGKAEMDNGGTGRVDVSLNLTNSRLNRLDAATLWNRPSSFVEGAVAVSGLNTSHVIFSLISTPLMKATQTFLAHPVD